jgi:hypothetical protein
MKHYSPKQINQIKQEVRTGKPLSIIADELAAEWGRPLSGVYTKVVRLSKNTRKINNTWTGPTRKPIAKKAPKPAVVEQVVMNLVTEPQLEENFKDRIEEIVADIDSKQIPVVQEICEEIVEKPIERQPAEIGIEVPVGVMSFVGTPSRIVVYQDHVRYYFDN